MKICCACGHLVGKSRGNVITGIWFHFIVIINISHELSSPQLLQGKAYKCFPRAQYIEHQNYNRNNQPNMTNNYNTNGRRYLECGGCAANGIYGACTQRNSWNEELLKIAIFFCVQMRALTSYKSHFFYYTLYIYIYMIYREQIALKQH